MEAEAIRHQITAYLRKIYFHFAKWSYILIIDIYIEFLIYAYELEKVLNRFHRFLAAKHINVRENALRISLRYFKD